VPTHPGAGAGVGAGAGAGSGAGLGVRPRRVRARRGEGDRLREEILEAVEQLLVKTGDAEAVSIRAVSQLVGVTAPSIYRHFVDKDAMVRAACTQAWERFDLLLIEAAERETDPLMKIKAEALAYLRFASSHPGEYKVLFMVPPEESAIESADNVFNVDKSEYTSLVHIAHAVEKAIEDGLIARIAEPMAMATMLWASVHGIASLRIAKPEVPWPSVEDQLELMFRLLSGGMCVQPGA
jgi:AcrR family transcriptional regulator